MTVRGFVWMPAIRLPEGAFGWWVVGFGERWGVEKWSAALGISRLATMFAHLPGDEDACLWVADSSPPTEVSALIQGTKILMCKK